MTGPSESSVQVEADAIHALPQPIGRICRIVNYKPHVEWFGQVGPAGTPLFTAEQMREYALAVRALPVAALSDSDRDLMQQTLEAIESAERYGAGNWPSLSAALRTRLLRHSEGKAE